MNQNNSKTFCLHPFTGLATREDGAICACCRSHPVGDITTDTLSDIWNNDTMKRIRKQVLNNERPKECEPCFSLEDQGVMSLRQRHINPVIPESRVLLYPNAMRELRSDYTMPFEFPTMELKLNNLCNLKCRMCHPMDSTSWNDWEVIEKYYKKENNIIYDIVEEHNLKSKPLLDEFEGNRNFWGDFTKLLPYFRRLEFAGGEPLMDPQHYDILDMLAPYGDNIEIKYATNLTMLGKGKRHIDYYWPKFKSVAVNVSIDGYMDSYEYIRGNAKWKVMIDNVRAIQRIKNVRRVVGAVTVQVSNIMVLDKMIEYFLDDLGIIFHSHRVSYPNLLSIQCLPQGLKDKAIENLERVRGKVVNFKMVKQDDTLYKYTMDQIDHNINFLRAKDLSHLWPDTLEFNRRLDVSRNQSFFDVTPEFRLYKDV